MTSIATRFRDALWSIKREFGMEADVDRIISFVVFERDFNENVLIAYPRQIPEDFKMALLARIQQIVRQYWAYRQTKRGFHKVRNGILFLENVARFRFEGCLLVEDKIVGWRLELKPEHKKK